MEEKDVLSHWFQKEEKGHAEQLFHTRVIVQERACALTIDQTALINAVSSELVEKLELPVQPISEPYYLRLGDIKLAITHQTLVQFMLGNLAFAVWCDVLPLHMVSCHLLLGRPWCTDQGATYHMEHYYYTKYVVPYGNKMYTLVSMDTMKYKAWRDEKLQKLKEEEEHKNKEAELKIREQEEAKKRDTEAAALLLVHVPSTADIVAFKSDSKPRTVSPEEGEDDVASPIHDSAYYAIPGYVVANTIKIKFLFLFLPRKENVSDAIGVQYWWSMLSLKESGWGPPSSMLKMVAYLQKSLFILVYCFIF
jgi:hypothetical protein